MYGKEDSLIHIPGGLKEDSLIHIPGELKEDLTHNSEGAEVGSALVTQQSGFGQDVMIVVLLQLSFSVPS